ncbi:BTB/POZ domain-containing protein [Dichanthelium oligosanthes]|uniref:BTB/POZ domain-containing protein n=1 Tax=Dichanthelium oligosanthes TaxID=888268 RepID=A0A1E5UIL2_9POAL|nr:BTB/POZ domain-containing protein [Dichanthelium oligosanthes]
MPTTTTASTAAAAQRRRSRRKAPPPRQPWCCSLGLDPSPAAASRSPLPVPQRTKPTHQLAPPLSRRIRSPGRVSPIDDPSFAASVGSCVSARLSSVTECPPPALPPPPPPPPAAAVEGPRATLRLSLVEKGVVLEVEEVERVRMESKVVRKVLGGRGGEVAVEGKVEVESFREAVEMMLADEDETAVMRRLARAGVARAIGVLENLVKINIERFGYCLVGGQIGTVAKYQFGILEQAAGNTIHGLVVELVDSITKGTNNNARKELRNLINGILSKSSVYIKGDKELDKRSIYCICHSCLNSLVGLFEESSDLIPANETSISSVGKGPLERIYRLVEDTNWLLQILIDRQMGEEFVDSWANEKNLSSMHERVSPMVRHELSRISATIFIAMGSGKLHCAGYKRFSFFQAWFRPMLVDFGWLRRYPKGLNVATLEEGIGQALLTLTLAQQQVLFTEWFEAFGGQGRECPNLMRAFQVWWRRSFVRSLGRNS